MKLLWQYLKQYKKILFGALALAMVNQVFSLLDPQIFRIIVDKYASRFGILSRSEFLHGIILLLLASVGVAMVSRIAKNFQDYFVNVITQRLGAKLYAHSVAHSFSLSYSVFEDQRSGELLQKLQKARTDSQTLIAGVVNVLFFSLVGMVFVIIYAFFVHWLIGAVYFLAIPFLGIITFIISRKIKTAQKKIVAETAGLAGSTTETLRNVELVKSLGLEQQEVDRLNAVNERILQLELRKIKLIRFFSFIQGTMINTLRSLLLLLMLWLIFQRDITLGQFLSLYIYSFFIFSPLAELGTVATNFQETRASMEQLQGVLKIPSESKPASPQSISSLENIEFRGVSFHYQDQDNTSVAGIDITVRAGETIAFVGPSGSGKTTLIKLLAGLYKPTSGTITYNGVSGEHIDFEELRKRIGLVSQETQLFAGTIRENLLFVNPHATDQQCLHAMGSAAAMPIVNRGNRGLATRIGEGGIKISGGERQRLAIARALLRNPELIIFDEATSSLDSITEKSITKTIQDIEKIHPALMTILVAHRLSTVSHADRIYVLEKGKIIEQGGHERLLQDGGLYAALWRQQIGSSGLNNGGPEEI
jgi:ATP-binding cassette, subfamily B, bacterial